MLLYFLATVMGFIIALLYNNNSKADQLETMLYRHAGLGKRVMVCIDKDVFLIQKEGDKFKITLADLEFMEVRYGDDLASMRVDQLDPVSCELPQRKEE